jgi:hypothetical protein
MLIDATTIAIIAGALALVATVVAVVALARQGAMRRHYAVLQGDDSRESFIEAVARKSAEVDALRGEVQQLEKVLDLTRVDVAESVRHIAVVRYDAFADMGGRMSFSAAFLDDAGDGLVLTSIHARTESRTYIKGVIGGAAETTLSPEEESAVRAAIEGRGRA